MYFITLPTDLLIRFYLSTPYIIGLIKLNVIIEVR